MSAPRKAVLLFALAASAFAASPIVQYRIQASLDNTKKSIEGHETLTWLNDSPDSINELQFHLYLNAFQNEKSSFMRESGGHLRGDRIPKEGWGYVEIRKMKVAGGADLSAGIRFIHPDDDNADDQTVAAVALPQSVGAGKTITLEIDFLSKLPKVFARTGYHNDFYMVGQWFPKIGVYERAGERYATHGQWNCHQFHANSEFYADYGEYDVTLTVPPGFVVGATGVQQSRNGNTYRFTQNNVHDFAWTASPRYIRIEREFDPAREVSPAELASVAKLVGKTGDEIRLKPVRMILLIQPEHREQTDRHFRALINGIKWFGLWYGAYPYPTITVVDPEFGADGAGGMEYPTLITAGTSWRAAKDEWNPEEVIIHEFGHQYWYGMVGTNEFEESWLDEGFNTYSTSKIIDQVYGPANFPFHFLEFAMGPLLGVPKITAGMINRIAYLDYRKVDPVVRNSWDYYDSTSYGINSYMRPATLLNTIEKYLGAPVMARIMRTWFERYQYRHPTSIDFRNVVNEVSGKNMNWYFDQFVFGTNQLDYRVASVESESVPIFRGLYLQNGKRVAVTDEDVEREKKKQKPEQFRTVVKLVREGETVMPVDMKLTLENGEVIERQWDGVNRWIKYEFTKSSRAKRVEIDPAFKIPLDSSFRNNSWTSDPDPLPFTKWASNLLFWAQMVLP